MSERSRNNARKTPGRGRGRPLEKGNPGRPKGARHRATLAAEALFDGESEMLTRKAIELALAGEPTALRLCLERILPPRRERPIRFMLPALSSPADTAGAVARIVVAVTAGELSLSEAAELVKLVESFVKASEVTRQFQSQHKFDSLFPVTLPPFCPHS
jgi:hypothetical protein